MPWFRTARSARPKKVTLQSLGDDIRLIRVHQAAGAGELGTTRFRVEQIGDRVADHDERLSQLSEKLDVVLRELHRVKT